MKNMKKLTDSVMKQLIKEIATGGNLQVVESLTRALLSLSQLRREDERQAETLGGLVWENNE